MLHPVGAYKPMQTISDRLKLDGHIHLIQNFVLFRNGKTREMQSSRSLLPDSSESSLLSIGHPPNHEGLPVCGPSLVTQWYCRELRCQRNPSTKRRHTRLPQPIGTTDGARHRSKEL